MNEEEKELEVIRIYKLVCDVSTAAHELICNSMDSLDGKNRWLAIGRVINNLSSHHYKIINQAQQKEESGEIIVKRGE